MHPRTSPVWKHSEFGIWMPGALSLLISRCCFLKWLFKSKLWENRDYESKKKAHNSSSLKDKVLKRLQGLERPRAWWRSIKWVLGWCWLPRATITDPQNLRRLPTTDTYCSTGLEARSPKSKHQQGRALFGGSWGEILLADNPWHSLAYSGITPVTWLPSPCMSILSSVFVCLSLCQRFPPTCFGPGPTMVHHFNWITFAKILFPHTGNIWRYWEWRLQPVFGEGYNSDCNRDKSEGTRSVKSDSPSLAAYCCNSKPYFLWETESLNILWKIQTNDSLRFVITELRMS